MRVGAHLLTLTGDGGCNLLDGSIPAFGGRWRHTRGCSLRTGSRRRSWRELMAVSPISEFRIQVGELRRRSDAPDCHSHLHPNPPSITRAHWPPTPFRLVCLFPWGGGSGLGVEGYSKNIHDLQNTPSAPTSASFPLLVPLATEGLSLHKTPLCSLHSGQPNNYLHQCSGCDSAHKLPCERRTVYHRTRPQCSCGCVCLRSVTKQASFDAAVTSQRILNPIISEEAGTTTTAANMELHPLDS